MTMAPRGRLAVCLHSEQEVWGQRFPTDNKEEWEHVRANVNKSEKKKAVFSPWKRHKIKICKQRLRLARLTGQTGCADLCRVSSGVSPPCDKGLRILTWWCTRFFRLRRQTTLSTCDISARKRLKQTSPLLCVKLYTFAIPNVSHSLQTEWKFLVLIKVMVHFIWPLAATFWEWGEEVVERD